MGIRIDEKSGSTAARLRGFGLRCWFCHACVYPGTQGTARVADIEQLAACDEYVAAAGDGLVWRVVEVSAAKACARSSLQGTSDLFECLGRGCRTGRKGSQRPSERI
jgi:hypothetical protein